MEDLRSFETVRRWIENVNRFYALSDEEWADRLAVLGRFCERVAKDPDAVIREATGERAAKVDFMRVSKQIAGEVAADARAAHDWDGVIRSFFLHNGARVVVRPYGE